MADEADAAQAEQELLMRQSLADASKRERLPFTGRCHNCEEPVKAGMLFCTPECREDFERLAWARRMRG